MKTTFTSLMLVGLLTSLGAITVMGVEQGPAPREIKFELSDHSVSNPIFYPEMTHVAEFHLTADRPFDAWILLCEETSQWQDISDAQRAFCTKLLDRYRIESRGVIRTLDLRPTLRAVPPGGRGRSSGKYWSFEIWGVSLEDTKAMALAVINRLDSIAASRFEAVEEEIKKNGSTLLETAKKRPVLETQYKELRQKVAETGKRYSQSNYDLVETGNSLFKHAVRTRDDVGSHLREVRFELLGLTAKQEAIESFKNSKKTMRSATLRETLLKLDQLLVINEVERVGALARESAYQEAFGQAKALVDAVLAKDTAGAQLDLNDVRRRTAEKELKIREKQFKMPPGFWKPVEVHDNLIRIMPVRH